MGGLMMTRICNGLTLVGMVVVLVSLPDAATAQRTRAKRDFKAFDVNNDGRLSFGEWKVKAEVRELAPKQARELFRAIDENRDGNLTADEIADWAAKKPKAKAGSKKRARAELETESQSQPSK
jgi:Ca2+-binding EF-hand superfamily protein